MAEQIANGSQRDKILTTMADSDSRLALLYLERKLAVTSLGAASGLRFTPERSQSAFNALCSCGLADILLHPIEGISPSVYAISVYSVTELGLKTARFVREPGFKLP